MISLYRYFDENDDLLYVGISKNPVSRIQQHATNDWIRRVRHIELEWFDTRSEALAAELIAIERERPEYNIAGSYSPRKLRSSPPEVFAEKGPMVPARETEADLAEIEWLWSRVGSRLTQNDVAAFCNERKGTDNVSRVTIAQWIAKRPRGRV